MPVPLSLQLYTLREELRHDLTGVLRRVADLGFIAVEPAGYHDRSPAEFGRIIRDVGLQISSAFGGFPLGAASEAVLDEHEALGNRMIVSGFGREQMASEDGVKRAAEQLAEGASNAAKRGMRIALHNHEFEFTNRYHGRSAYAWMLEMAGPAVFAELDIYWARAAGEDPAAIVAEQPARFPLLHVKDGPCVMGQPMTALGEGVVDVPAVLRAATSAEWHVVELDQCATDMFAAVRAGYDFLTKGGFSRGRV